VSPDDAELWVTDPGSPDPRSPAGPGHILIFDAASGVAIDTILTDGLDPINNWPLWVNEIRFHPQGRKAYISCGVLRRGGGPILVIDVRERRILDLIYGDFVHLPVSIEISPIL
jgi:hypothetical protein